MSQNHSPAVSTPVALTIAGSDPSGGAGIQADLKTFHQHGVFGTAVITLLTVQNTTSVKEVVCNPEQLTVHQLQAVLEDIPPQAAKTGALGNSETITAVARELRSFFAATPFPLVVDPVMISKHGAPLLSESGVAALKAELLPLATLVTPNTLEAEALTGHPVRDIASMEQAATLLIQRGAKNVLIKGGHLEGVATDVLLSEGEFLHLPGERYETKNTHGTGCVLSAAITAHLARGTLGSGGKRVAEAVHRAKQFVAGAIRTNPGLGHGQGPINLFFEVDC